MKSTNNQKYRILKERFEKRDRNIRDTFWRSHGKQLAAGSLGGLMLLSSPAMAPLPLTPSLVIGEKLASKEGKGILLREDLAFEVPSTPGQLDPDQEKKIAETLSKYYGFTVTPEIDGRRLNRTYGVIGTEQHLYRYPGDQLYKHADNAFEWSTFGKYGIAPGLGAWGSFASSQNTFSGIDALREKFYIAVQTFLAPGFNKDVAGFRDFFRYRKMLVVNPKTGQAVVADIGDAGPAQWTGKQLGGSPEVMHYLGLAGGPAKGPVLYFFIDDPTDSVPLGPITP